MNDLDRELAEAVAESEETAAETPVSKPAPPKSSSPKRSLGLLAAVVVIGGAVLALVMTGVEDAAIYAVSTDRLVAEKDKFKSRTVRVEGTLVKGSLARRDEPCEYRFSIEKNGASLPVRYPHCVVPDTFRDVPDMDVSVTAEGQLGDEGHFQATSIMAKCPSKYEMKQRAQKGEAAPHAPLYPEGDYSENAPSAKPY